MVSIKKTLRASSTSLVELEFELERDWSLMSGQGAGGSVLDHAGAAAGPSAALMMMGPGGGPGSGLMMNGLSIGSVDAGNNNNILVQQQQQDQGSRAPSRYEAQKRRDWNTFGQYLRNHRPPLALGRCTGQQVLDFVRYLDQFGKTKVHLPVCPFFGLPHPPQPCTCPLRQAWGSLDALIGRLRAAFEENGGRPESNPFGARAVRLYLREVRESQAKARGIAYEKKKRKRLPPQSDAAMDNVTGSTAPHHVLPATATQ